MRDDPYLLADKLVELSNDIVSLHNNGFRRILRTHRHKYAYFTDNVADTSPEGITDFSISPNNIEINHTSMGEKIESTVYFDTGRFLATSQDNGSLHRLFGPTYRGGIDFPYKWFHYDHEATYNVESWGMDNKIDVYNMSDDERILFALEFT